MAEKNEKIAEFIRLQSSEERLRLVCEWTLRFYENGQTLAVHVAAPQEAGRLDEMLWTFQDGSFVPHVRASEAEEPVMEPVVICSDDQPAGEADVYIEAAGGEPREQFRNFLRILDFAELYDEGLAEASRRRYRAYKEAGYRMRYIR